MTGTGNTETLAESGRPRVARASCLRPHGLEACVTLGAAGPSAETAEGFPAGHGARGHEGRSRRLPAWLRVPFRGAAERGEVGRLLRRLELNTVCEGAHCPNLCECWQRRTATFMILGDRCTRQCRFCAVPTGQPAAVDPDEPARVAEAAERLSLRHAVVTSVTRDDLADGGAGQFAAVIDALRRRCPAIAIEVLTPDFGGASAALLTVLKAAPDVLNHNLETSRRLSPAVRPQADYERSLALLRAAACEARVPMRVKSGFMLGMGETAPDVRELLADLRAAGVTVLTIGQYLPPSAAHWPLDRYVPPDEFDEWGRIAREEYGFAAVASAPRVRSSYLADGLAAAAAAAGELARRKMRG